MGRFNKLRKSMGYSDGGIVDLSPEEQEQLALAKAKSEQGEEVGSPSGQFRSGLQSILGKADYGTPEKKYTDMDPMAFAGLMGAGSLSSPASKMKFLRKELERPQDPNFKMPTGEIEGMPTPPPFEEAFPSKFLNKASPEEFQKAIEEASKTNPKIKEFISQYSPEELREMSLMLSDNKLSGGAVKSSGELTSVFSGEKGKGDKIISELIEQATPQKAHLDAFEGYLTDELYPKHGFKPYKREPNWEAGKPDVVYMAKPEAFPHVRELMKKKK